MLRRGTLETSHDNKRNKKLAERSRLPPLEDVSPFRFYLSAASSVFIAQSQASKKPLPFQPATDAVRNL